MFISYSRQDVDVARRFAEALVASGIDLWWDNDLRSGETFDDAIEAALRAAKVVVVLWSPFSVVSRWVRAEATTADRLGTILPVMIAPCERPIIFDLLHTTDLSAWKGNIADRAWTAFLGQLRRKTALGADAPSPVEIAAGYAFKLPSKPSIALLPFKDISLGAQSEGFTDGIVEEISATLSHFQTLFVIAGASSLSYRNTGKDPATICRELGVRYLLEGSVRQSRGRVRITVKLVDGIDGAQVWAEKFDDGLEDIFELQDRVATAVASRIDSSIDSAELERAVQHPTSSPDANELYWRANAMFRRFDPQSIAEAIALLDQALVLDPEHGWAAALNGFCHSTLFGYGWSGDPAGSRTAALGHYETAMRQAGNDPRVMCYCGAILLNVGGDGDVATRLANRALELNPGSATNLFWSGWNDAIIGEPERGLQRLEDSIRLNPRSVVRPLAVCAMGICLFEMHRFEEAIGVLNEVLQQLPQFPPALACVAASLAHAGRSADARAAAVRLQAMGGGIGVLAGLRRAQDVELLQSGLAAIKFDPAAA